MHEPRTATLNGNPSVLLLYPPTFFATLQFESNSTESGTQPFPWLEAPTISLALNFDSNSACSVEGGLRRKKKK